MREAQAAGAQALFPATGAGVAAAEAAKAFAAGIPQPGMPQGFATVNDQVAPPGGFGSTGDLVAMFCTACTVDQSTETALRALPGGLQQLVMAEGPASGPNASAIVMARVQKAALGPQMAVPSFRPRPETMNAAASGDPVAILCAQGCVDYSAENALRSLPVELQCRVLNEGPLRAPNPSAALMSRVRKARIEGLSAGGVMPGTGPMLQGQM